MLRMAHLAILFCVSLVVFAGPVALAGSNSPTGTWETSITGKVNGDSLTGTAYIEFLEDGSCSGHWLRRHWCSFKRSFSRWVGTSTR